MSIKNLSPTYGARLKTVVEVAGKGDRLLDLGCGDGSVDLCLNANYKRLCGIDINEEDIETARFNKEPNMEYFVGDCCGTPFSDGEFDTVICIDVLEHLEDDQRAVREISRVLCPGGKLVLSVPNADYPFTFDPLNRLIGLFSGRHLKIGAWGFGHLRLYDAGRLERLLTENGLFLQETRYLSHYITGLCENYLSTLLQPLVKSNASNTALSKSRNNSRRSLLPGRNNKLVDLLSKATDYVIRADSTVYKGSKTSVGILMVAKKG